MKIYQWYEAQIKPDDLIFDNIKVIVGDRKAFAWVPTTLTEVTQVCIELINANEIGIPKALHISFGEGTIFRMYMLSTSRGPEL